MRSWNEDDKDEELCFALFATPEYSLYRTAVQIIPGGALLHNQVEVVVKASRRQDGVCDEEELGERQCAAVQSLFSIHPHPYLLCHLMTLELQEVNITIAI